MKPTFWRALFGSVLVLSLIANIYWWQQSASIGKPEQAWPSLVESELVKSGGKKSDSRSSHQAGVASWAQLESDLNYLFEGKEYRMAFAGVAAANSHYPNQVAILINRWFRKNIEALQESSKLSLLNGVERLLDAAASRYYRSMEYQWLQAEHSRASGNALEAVDLFIELQQNSNGELRHELDERINRFLEGFFTEVYRDLNWTKGLQMAERLLWHRPNDGEFLLLKADLLVQQQWYAEAEQPLQVAITIPDYEQKARKMLDRINLLKLRDTSIPLVSVGRSQYLVETNIIPVEGDREYSANLLLDTGASLTVLTQNFFQKIAVGNRARIERNAVMNTAGGRVEAPIYNIKRFRVGEYELSNLDVVVMDYPSGESQGLLGMNFLGQFDFEIDQENQWLILGPKP